MNAEHPPLICAIRGPVTVIALGVLFALNNFTRFGIEKTWPVLLIVFGLMSVLRRGAVPACDPAPVRPYAPPPPANPQPPVYNTPPAAPDRGGFGASAPAKPARHPAPPAEGGGGI